MQYALRKHTNMKKYGLGFLFVLIIAMSSSLLLFADRGTDRGLMVPERSQVTHSEQLFDDPSGVRAESGGSGGFPSGLDVESKFELAVGERYSMEGSVDIVQGVVVFRVDLKQYHRLATQDRLKRPFYFIETTDVRRWKKWEGKAVLLNFVVHGYVVQKSNGSSIYELFLNPTATPTEIISPNLRR